MDTKELTTERIILCLGPVKKQEGVKSLMYETELSLLKAFFKLMIMKNPDFTLGYNIFGFDDRYIRIRTDIYRHVDPDIDDLEKK